MCVKVIASQRWDVFFETLCSFAMSYTGCLCILSEYSLKLHYFQLYPRCRPCVFPARLRIDSESFWPSRSPFCGTLRSGRAENSNGTRQTKFQRCRSCHLEQSSETSALIVHLQRTVSAWTETHFFLQACSVWILELNSAPPDFTGAASRRGRGGKEMRER